MSDKIEKTIAFMTGDLVAMVVSYKLLGDIASATIIAIATGFFGGAAAIAGKMLITWLFKKKEKDDV